MAPPSGFKAFLQTPAGRALLIALAIGVTTLAYAYASPLFAIPAMLLVGFALPIWVGLKRIRFIALLGLVVLLTTAPLATLVYAQEIMVPVGPAASATDLPGGGGGALMQNAQVSPFVGGLSTNFTWNVTVVPAYIPQGNDSPYQLTLYISTCPGATGTGDPNCQAGYPFYQFNRSLPANLTANTTVSFGFVFPSEGIWAWQIGAFLENSSAPAAHNATFILLVGDPVYNGIEGPVVGDFTTVWEEFVLTVYLDAFVYLGIPFYIVLLVYMYIKRRQSQRGSAIARAPGPVPTETASPGSDGGGTSGPPPPGSTATSVDASAPRRAELPCPNCGAVVYPNETTCWKCGKKLSGAGGSGGSSPLPSGDSR